MVRLRRPVWTNADLSNLLDAGSVASMLSDLIEIGISMAFKIGAVLIFSPIFLVPGVVVTAVGWMIGKIYMAAQLSVKREMSNARSPVYSHFGASIAGVVSIRAFGVQEAFKAESRKRIDFYTRPARTFYNLNRLVGLRLLARPV